MKPQSLCAMPVVCLGLLMSTMANFILTNSL
ncbi:Uncharacterised protein [Klebsiella pneumoniae]|uniref:Uncharacterized protein n=1 Tax=Klebsiella pneumoniae TaxID=573 RepID=A0A486UY85_KLEPN|nr:Uncharacterised protein [Klebsiella pneumoniae]SWX73862.1 Uncharacterised protein [Klebsiella pneumoniae]VGM43168.1 Uncharacterised protein [Klebsiella pneumoniae]